MSDSVDDLIARWKVAKDKYDDYLNAAFNMVVPDGKGGFKVQSEDRAKLQARLEMRRDGLEDPEVLKMYIWARIGVRIVSP